MAVLTKKGTRSVQVAKTADKGVNTCRIGTWKGLDRRSTPIEEWVVCGRSWIWEISERVGRPDESVGITSG